MKRKIGELLSRDELRTLSRRSNLRGALAVLGTWGVIAAVFVGLVHAARLPLPLAIPAFAIGLVILGGRHLALAILHHEAAHKSLFATTWLNDAIGDWLCARPVWNHLGLYRAHHLKHHARTNQPDDPDLSLIDPFPVRRSSLRRKLWRDVAGISGLKFLIGHILRDAGAIQYTVSNTVVRLPRKPAWRYVTTFFANAAGMMLTNGLLFAALSFAGHAWLYGIWVLAYVTPYPLFLRIRSLAEHACTARSEDIFENTRTTRAGLLARATVAPIRVNYHLEHHALPAVPFYRLPALHRLLRARGAPAPPSYRDVLRIVSTRPAA